MGIVVIGAVFGAAVSAVSELVVQVVNHVVTGDEIDWGDVATSAAEGAVYGGVMAATGSHMAASMAATATATVIDGVRAGDSFGEIIADTAINTMKTAALCAAPKIVNKSLSGKYAKLNKVQKFIKNKTADPYQGKYSSGPNYLGDSLERSFKRGRNNVLIGTGKIAVGHILEIFLNN